MSSFLSQPVQENKELDGEIEMEDNEPVEQQRPGYLSPHFREAEFACNHCGALPEAGIDPELVEILERVRVCFNAPVVVNSGYRCPQHNRNVGGARRSQHLQGTAADIRVVGFSPSEIYDYLKKIRRSKGGLGLYKTFTHVDTGPDGRRW